MSARNSSPAHTEQLSLHNRTVPNVPSLTSAEHAVYFPLAAENNRQSGPGLQAVTYYPIQMDNNTPTCVTYALDPSQTAPIYLTGQQSHQQSHATQGHSVQAVQSCPSTIDPKYLDDYLKVIESFQGGATPPSMPIYANNPPSYFMSQNTTTDMQMMQVASPSKRTDINIDGSSTSLDHLTPARVAATFNFMYAQAFLNPPSNINDLNLSVDEDIDECCDDEDDDGENSGSSSESLKSSTDYIHTSAPDAETPIINSKTSQPDNNVLEIESTGLLVCKSDKSAHEKTDDKSDIAVKEEETSKDVIINSAVSDNLVALQSVTQTENADQGVVTKSRILPPRKKRKDYFIPEEEEDVIASGRINRRKRGKPKRSIQTNESALSDDDELDGSAQIDCSVAGASGKSGCEKKSPRGKSRGTKVCEKCNRRFERNDTYRRHLLLHDTKHMYGCHVCGGKYERQEHLTRHLRVHSGEVYCCDFCNATFFQQRPFRDHMQAYHEEKRPFVCHVDGCTFRAQTPSQVDKHSEIHSDQKQYSCEKCGRDFAQINGLRSHQRSCYEKRQYLCDFCGSKFNFLGSLKSHRYIHTGEKPYNCPDCDAKFTDHRNMRRHRLIHENSYPYPCTMCDKKFRHSNSLKAHFKIHQSSSTMSSNSASTQHQNVSQVAPSLPVSGLTNQWERPEAQLVHEYMLALQQQATQVTQQVSQVTQQV